MCSVLRWFSFEFPHYLFERFSASECYRLFHFIQLFIGCVAKWILRFQHRPESGLKQCPESVDRLEKWLVLLLLLRLHCPIQTDFMCDSMCVMWSMTLRMFTLNEQQMQCRFMNRVHIVGGTVQRVDRENHTMCHRISDKHQNDTKQKWNKAEIIIAIAIYVVVYWMKFTDKNKY